MFTSKSDQGKSVISVSGKDVGARWACWNISETAEISHKTMSRENGAKKQKR